jgi:hypothetical protein
VDRLVATKRPQKYDQATRILIDLRDLAAWSSSCDFESRLVVQFRAQALERSLIVRIGNANGAGPQATWSDLAAFALRFMIMIALT